MGARIGAGLFGAAASLALLSPPAYAADACAHPGTYLRPIVATHIRPPYPETSQMTQEEGTTLLQVSIGKDGVVTKAEVNKSSGSLRLDQAALDFVKANWRWQPPMIDCQPSEVVTRISIVWSLQEQNSGPPPGVVMLTPDAADYPPDALARREQGVTGLIVALSETGVIAQTHIQFASGFPDLDNKALQLAQVRKWTAAQMNGKPVATIIELAVQWKLQDAAPK